MNNRTFLEEWQDFADHMVPTNCSPNRKRDMRRAFYAGAFICFGHLNRMSDNEDVTPKDIEIINNLHEELHDFMTRIAQGVA